MGNADLVTVIDGDCVAVTVAESVSPTEGPVGGVPATVAVLVIDPEFMSPNVTAYDAVHVIVALAANDDPGHDTADKPGNGSETTIDDNVTLPLFVTKNEYVTVWPAADTDTGRADLPNVIDGLEASTMMELLSNENRPQLSITDSEMLQFSWPGATGAVNVVVAAAAFANDPPAAGAPLASVQVADHS